MHLSLLLFLVLALTNVDFAHGELFASTNANFAKRTFQSCGDHTKSFDMSLAFLTAACMQGYIVSWLVADDAKVICCLQKVKLGTQ